ncbi:MAG: VOC family protein [Planctomycetes bacterium]|nr:VOC family protein [Planctomycetota bacterium]
MSEKRGHYSTENTIPVLAVSNVEASIAFYRDTLGFQEDWRGSASPLFIASVSRNRHAIMLQRRTPADPGWVWIGVSSVLKLWEQIRSTAIERVVLRPTNQQYALEVRVHDPDGNTLWFGSEPLEGIPFGQTLSDDDIARLA